MLPFTVYVIVKRPMWVLINCENIYRNPFMSCQFVTWWRCLLLLWTRAHRDNKVAPWWGTWWCSLGCRCCTRCRGSPCSGPPPHRCPAPTGRRSRNSAPLSSHRTLCHTDGAEEEKERGDTEFFFVHFIIENCSDLIRGVIFLSGSEARRSKPLSHSICPFNMKLESGNS